MKIHISFSIVLLVAVVSEATSINSNHFIIDTSEECKVTNELYWKMIQWFYGPLKFVDVNILTESSTTLSMNQLATMFLKEIADREFNHWLIMK